MTDEEVYALLATDGMLVKRPIIVTENYVLTGFKEAEWQEKMKKYEDSSRRFYKADRQEKTRK
jgi:hypothetical protein